MGLFIKSLGKDFLGIFVGAEGKVVDVLGVKSSSEGGFGILSGLAGLCLSIDEDVIGFLEFLSGDVENFLGVFKIFLGNCDDSSLVVDIADGKSDNFVGGFKDFVSFCFSSQESQS